ncbi:MAG: GNAT family N-acetyltransferase [Caldilineaceae bacterium]
MTRERTPDHAAPTLALLDHRNVVVANRIHAVQMAAYAQEAALLGATDFPPLRRTVADIRADDARYVGALVETTLAGVIWIETEGNPLQATIAGLVVAPAYQRRGIARRLLRHVLHAVPGQTFTVSTGAANLPALALYTVFGFVEVARTVLGPDALVVVTLRCDRGADGSIRS